ncbi:MAG: hypothetical protein IT366_04615 [Candidatus Hydrogenedentes bacterium]|nr:hypothetical protein [Candidatus Hydrogenedentota bacterium]
MLPTSLLPITGLIRRELLSSLRGSRYFYIVLLAVVIAGISIAGLWPPDNPMPWQMKSASQGIMILLGLTLGGGAAISIPALAGSSIVSEREEETFELLAMSTAKPWHVLIAKLINSAGHYLLLVAALAPFAACAFFLVGVNTQVLWRTLLIISTTTLAWAAAGVLCSAKMKKPMAAVGVSYLAMIFILGLPWFVPIGVLELFNVNIGDDFLDNFGIYALPMISFIVALEGGPASTRNTYSVEICSLVNIAITILLILIAHALVRRNWGMSERVEEEKPVFRRRAPVVHRDRPGIIPRPRHLFDGTTNPVYLREAWYEYPIRRWMGALQVGVPFILAFCATGLTALVFVINFNRNDDWMIAFVFWHFAEAMLLPLLLAALTANMFTKEHERENIDALRMTLLQPWEIFSGKLFASLRVAGLLLASGAVGSAFLIVTLIKPVDLGDWARLSGFQHIACAFIMIAECLAVTWAVTAFCSILTRKMAPAVVLSFVLSAIMLGGIAVMVIVVGEGMRMYRVQNWVGMFSPYFAYGLLLDDATNRYSIFGWNWSHLVVAVIIAAFLAAAAQLFVTRHMRDQ